MSTHSERIAYLKQQIKEAEELEALELQLAEIQKRRDAINNSEYKKITTVNAGDMPTIPAAIKKIRRPMPFPPKKIAPPKPKNKPVMVKAVTSTFDSDRARRLLANGDLKGAEMLAASGTRFTLTDTHNLAKAIGDKKMLMKFTFSNGKSKYITYTPKSRLSIESLLNEGFTEVKKKETTGSDAIDNLRHYGIVSLKFEDVLEKVAGAPTTNIMTDKNGNFFRYINKSVLDLSRYQIIKESDDYESILKNRCLIHTLEQCGIENAKLKAVIATYTEGVSFRTYDLKRIAGIIGKRIKLYKLDTKQNKIRATMHGPLPLLEVISIAIYKDHYFIYEDTIYTEFSIKNFKDILKYKDWHNISKRNGDKYVKSTGVKKINSLKMIHLLFEQNIFDGNHHLLIKLDEYHKKAKPDLNIPLDNIASEQELVEFNKKEKNDSVIWFADFESIVSNVDGSNADVHKGFKGGLVRQGSKMVYIFNSTKNNRDAWYDDMFSKIADVYKRGKYISPPIVYFHNVKYDFSLIMRNLFISSMCEKESQLYEIAIRYHGVEILLRDSYKLIPEKLSDFPKVFGLPDDLKKQEAISYTYYNDVTMYKTVESIDNYKSKLNPNDHKKFMENVKIRFSDDSGYEFDYDEKEQTFNPSAYYDYYLKYDVLVLQAGLEKYASKIKALVDLNIYDHLTISSLTNYYMRSCGAFDGLYEVTGNLRDFLSKAVYGGRVDVLKSAVKKIITKELADYDACSLYPSSLYRLCNEKGLPKGTAKQITGCLHKESIENIDNMSYYVVRVHINAINKKQNNPFVAYRDGESLKYINEVPKGGFEAIIDQITLEDYIKYHDIEYTILSGVYWNEGYNKKIGSLINDLYKKRVKEKALMKTCKKSDVSEHNCMQGVIKLMLNSAYGKTIIKKTVKKVVIRKNDNKFANYIASNFNTIESFEAINDRQYAVKMYQCDLTYNLSQVGLLCLSYSKRIMNEVMGLANDNDIMIYYQDTDSMHMNLADVKKLEDLFRKEYGRELTGSDMGCFHVDFDLKGANGAIKSIKSIFLAKKCYIDELVADNGVTGYHIRMKGVTVSGIEEASNRYGGPMQLFEALASGESVDFILNPVGGKVMMEYVGGSVRTVEEGTFTRTLKF